MDQNSVEGRRASDGQCGFSPIQMRENSADKSRQPQYDTTNMLFSDRSLSFLYTDLPTQPAQAASMIWTPPTFDVLAPRNCGMDYAMISAFGNRPNDVSLLELEQSESATETFLSTNASMWENPIFPDSFLAHQRDLLASPLMPTFAEEMSPDFSPENLHLASKQSYSNPNTISDSIGHTIKTIDNGDHKFVGVGVSASHGLLNSSSNYWLDSKIPDIGQGPMASHHAATSGSV